VKIILNGEPYECEAGTNLLAIAKALSLEGKRYAIEHNKEIVPKAKHEKVTLQDGDEVEVVQAIGGG
jgi:sulfur carrier protein